MGSAVLCQNEDFSSDAVKQVLNCFVRLYICIPESVYRLLRVAYNEQRARPRSAFFPVFTERIFFCTEIIEYLSLQRICILKLIDEIIPVLSADVLYQSAAAADVILQQISEVQKVVRERELAL